MLLPDSVKDSIVWLNGRYISWDAARIHIITHGLHYASCVFEGERVYNGKIFKSREHSARLIKSAQILRMNTDYSIDDLEEAKRQILERSGLENAYMRAFIWRGGEGMGITAPEVSINTAIAAWEWPAYFPVQLREQGISLKTSRWLKPSPDTAPVQAKAAGLYMIATLSKSEANDAGFHDALMLDYRGFVAEATGANLFMVKNGILLTPLPDCFLNGITRLTVIDLARQFGIEVAEKHISPEELMQADEIFITGTAAEITAIGKIDDKIFNVGPVTRRLRDAYEALVRA